MSVAKSTARENFKSLPAGEEPIRRARHGSVTDLADLLGLIAILVTSVVLVVLLGAAAASVLAAAGGFVVVSLRLWLRRR
ncbi:hypothetical protein AB0L82_43320 [Nocardia sp. NPDC052001]|uniref:hypothetical protein n=1 Tax=Nocardia sp. NPDC052001 TaxID=3154853 RepID=UPI00343147CD